MGNAIARHFPSITEGFIPAMAKAYSRWRHRREFQRLARNDPFAVERLARDLNLDTASLLAVAQGNATSELLSRRLRLLGLDPGEIARREPAMARDMARCCAFCPSKKRCARDLARANRADWQDYCPNKPTLDALGPEFAVQAGH